MSGKPAFELNGIVQHGLSFYSIARAVSVAVSCYLRVALDDYVHGKHWPKLTGRSWTSAYKCLTDHADATPG